MVDLALQVHDGDGLPLGRAALLWPRGHREDAGQDQGGEDLRQQGHRREGEGAPAGAEWGRTISELKSRVRDFEMLYRIHYEKSLSNSR